MTRLKGDIVFNGDFSALGADGKPVGWSFADDGANGTTTVATDTVLGVSKNVVVLNRTADEGGGAGILQTVARRDFVGPAVGRTRLFPNPMVQFRRYAEITLTHRMVNIAHAGVSTFLGAAYSFYHWDMNLNGTNLPAPPAYYGGFGPAGVAGGQGATGGIGSTSGYVTEKRVVEFKNFEKVGYVNLNFILHDPDAVGTWKISEIGVRFLP